MLYRALTSRDRRFDGRIWFGVVTTGVFCRPVCPAQTPKRENVRFFGAPAAAVAAGFRACRRCRPDTVPGARGWDLGSDLADDAITLIGAGVVDEVGVAGLARRLHVSERHLHRTLVSCVGVGPLDLAVSRRAQTARLLLDQTRMSLADVAFAAGFASVRQFNDVIRREFGAAPSTLRGNPIDGPTAGPSGISLRLHTRRPLAVAALGTFLRLRTVTGLERHVPGQPWRHERVLDVPGGVVHVVVEAGGPTRSAAPSDHVVLRCTGAPVTALGGIVTRVRRWLDLDAVPAVVDDVLGGDPALRTLVAECPGLRVPTTPDVWETFVRAVLGQQVTLSGGLTLLARLVERFAPEDRPTVSGLTVAPSAVVLAEADPARIAEIGVPLGRARALQALATAVAVGDIDPVAEPDRALANVVGIRGIGPWTRDYLALRAFGDPDAFPVTDIGIRRGAAAVGLPANPPDLLAHAQRWRPWRAYAAQHLWNVPNTRSSPSTADATTPQKETA